MAKIFKEEGFYSDLEKIVRDLNFYFSTICDFSEDGEFNTNVILEKFQKSIKDDNEHPLGEILEEFGEIQKIVSTLETYAEQLRKKEKDLRVKILSLEH